MQSGGIGEYTIIEKISTNEQNPVYLCRNFKQKVFAIRQISIQEKHAEVLKKEIGNFLRFDHPNIVNTKQFFFSDKEQKINIVWEYCAKGSLSQLIGNLSKKRMHNIMINIAKGIDYLHNQQHFTHANLKPENIFVDQQNIKIGDFGISVLLSKNKESGDVFKTFYMSKEFLLYDMIDNDGDIWALGIIFIEILTGKRIFHILEDQLHPCMRSDFPASVLSLIEDIKMRQLIKHMLESNPQKRIKIQKIIHLLQVSQKQEKKQNAKTSAGASVIIREGLQKRSKVTQKDGSVYEGSWLDDKKQGFGIKVWPDGSKYQGQWHNDHSHGKGKFIHADENVYEGEFENGKANGYGVYIVPNGSRYEGQWENDIQHGFGVQSWTDGSKYEGEFKEGKKAGKGRYQWSDGSNYEGEWKNNMIDGRGKYIWTDMRSYEGEWKTNKMHGKGNFMWPDGRRYQGQYQQDKKQGYGIFYWPDGRKYDGYWSQGKQHGHGKYINSQNFMRQGMWQNGKRIKWLTNDIKI